MSLYEKSINILELPFVLELLASEAVSDAAKEEARGLRPSKDIYEVKKRQEETSDAKKMIALKGSPGFSGVKDVSASLRRAERGGMLNMRELLDIAGVMHAARSVKSYADGERSAKTSIDYLFAALRANKYLEEKITTSIIGEDEIADGASKELSDIRRHMRVAGDRIRQALQKILTSSYYANALQEPIITMRGDRYVIPVKAEHKSMVQGIVHDISSSGATLFIEPISAVQINNEIRELMIKEKNEIDRILMELSAECASYAEEIMCDFNMLVKLDLIFAKAKLSYKQNAGEPGLSETGELILKGARHPMLPEKTAVPIDVRLGNDYDTLVITGPNTGGKTVTLKTMGLICLMAECGLHIPAKDGSVIPIFDKILADIGDEQSIEQSLSTFSAHMTNIVKILEECSDNTLLLFDELGAGTDPVEGAALAISIIEFSRKMGSEIAATTHYAELKIYATTTEGVQNASCEFDVETLRPTYRLLIGIPGKSNAFAISSRLGLPDFIVDDAKKRVSSESANFEEVLEKLEESRQQLEREKAETQRLLLKAEEDSKQAEAYKESLKKEKEKSAVIARREASRIIDEARRTADEVCDEMDKLRKSAAKEADWQRVNDAKAEIRRKLNKAEDSLGYSEEEEAPAPSSRPIKAGDTVVILSMGTKANVISISPDRTLTLQAGIMKVTAKESEVRLVLDQANGKAAGIKSAASDRKYRETKVVSSGSGGAKPELDIRGMMTDEAIPVVERFIDSAVMGKLNVVTIIHGKGTGALRAAVHKSLRTNKQVKSFRLGRFGEGENGVTVVELK